MKGRKSVAIMISLPMESAHSWSVEGGRPIIEDQRVQILIEVMCKLFFILPFDESLVGIINFLLH